MGGDIGVDGGLQFGNAGEHAAPNAVVGDVSEEAFDHVEPGRAGRGEVHMEARVLGEPRPDLGVFMGGVVVDDQVQLLVLGGRSVVTGHHAAFFPGA